MDRGGPATSAPCQQNSPLQPSDVDGSTTEVAFQAASSRSPTLLAIDRIAHTDRAFFSDGSATQLRREDASNSSACRRAAALSVEPLSIREISTVRSGPVTAATDVIVRPLLSAFATTSW